MIIGPHVNRNLAPARRDGARPSIVDHIAAARGEAAGAGFVVGAAAIFVGGPQRREITLNDDERLSLREYIRATGVTVVAHSAYAANPWGGAPEVASYLIKELRVCQEAGIGGLVVHLPKAPSKIVMEVLPSLDCPDAPDVRIYLETPAVTPKSAQYATGEQLARLFGEIRAAAAARGVDPDRYGLCVDTAHLWTSGVDLRSYEDAERWLDGIPDVPLMFHLNDSLRARGTGPDAHAPLAAGRIWEGYRGAPHRSGIAAVLDAAKRRGAPVVLERTPAEALIQDYHLLRGLVGGAAEYHPL